MYTSWYIHGAIKYLAKLFDKNWGFKNAKLFEATLSYESIDLSTFFHQINSKYGLIAGFFFGYIPSIYLSYRNLGFSIKNRRYILRSINLNLAIVKFTLPASVMSTISIQIIPILIIRFFGNDFAGYYGMAYRILGFPLSLIGAALGQGLFKEASDDTSKIDHFARSLVVRSSKYGAPAFLILIFVGYITFTYLLPEWRNTALLLPALGIMFLFNIITSPLSSIPTLINRNEFSLFFTFAELTLRPLSIVIFHNYGGFYSLFGISLITSLLLLFYYFKIYNFIDIKFSLAIKDITPTIITSLLLILISIQLIGGQ